MTEEFALPGLGADAAHLLTSLLGPRVTSLTPAMLAATPVSLFGAGDDDLAALGITVSGNPDLSVVVTDPARPVGRLHVEAIGRGNLLFLDNRLAAGSLHGNIRILGQDCAVLFDRLGDSYIALHDVFLRGDGQILFWGAGSSAVGCSIEWEGQGRALVIGEDALISSGIWFRNHDMHAVHDLTSGERINRGAVDTVLERHVWIGQNALLLNCERIGMGSIIGAMSLVKGAVGRCVAIAGAPARVIRTDVSWGRDIAGMTAQERVSLGLPALPG